MHVQKHECSSCGYPAAKTRKCRFQLPLGITHDRFILTQAQSTGARRAREEGQSELAAHDTSRTSRVVSRMASELVNPRVLEEPLRRSKEREGQIEAMMGAVDARK